MAHVNGNSSLVSSSNSSTATNVHIRQALRCFRRKEFGKSCAYFCIAFSLDGNLSAIENGADSSNASNSNAESLFTKYKGTFLYCLSTYTGLLEEKMDFDGVVEAYQHALTACPNSEDVHFLLASFHCRRLKYCQATYNLLQAIKINPNYHLAYILLENIKSSAIKRWHFSMMNDLVRNNAFREAIRIGVQKGHNVVLDIGAGCGLLSYFAAEAGASEVYACEVNELIYHVCKDVLTFNELNGRVKLINKMSTELTIGEDLPRKVSLVVTEIFDSAVFGELCLPTIIHAWKQLIATDETDQTVTGLVIPKMATIYGVLLQSETLRHQFCLKRKVYGNFKIPDDVFVSDDDTTELKYTTEDFSRIEDLKYLSEPFVITTVDFNDHHSLERMLHSEYELRFSATVNQAGHLHALGVWFDLNLIDNISVSTNPDSPSTAWEQTVYNLTIDRHVKPGDLIHLAADFHNNAMDIKDLNVQRPEKCIFVTEEIMRYLNATTYGQFVLERCTSLLSAMSRQSGESWTAATILDFSYFPLFSIHAATLPNVKRIDVVQEGEEVTSTLKSFMEYLSPECAEKINVISYDQLLAKTRSDCNVLLMDFVEGSGLLRSNLLERMFYLKVTLFKNQPLKLFPAKLTILGMVIQSNDLLRRSRLISNDNVGGLKVCEFINILETETIQEINLIKFDYSALTNHVELLELNLTEEVVEPDESLTEPTCETETLITGTGEAQAVIFWYLIHSGANFEGQTESRTGVDSTSTKSSLIFNSRSESSWNQAAFIVKNPFSVRKGDSLTIKTTFCQGFLRIKLKKLVN